MNRQRPFASQANAIFKPAASFLSNLANNASQASSGRRAYLTSRSSSIDETADIEALAYTDNYKHSTSPPPGRTMSRSLHRTSSSGELQPPSVPLIDFSRSPSPYSRASRSAAQSEDEDEGDYFDPRGSSRPLVAADVASGDGGSLGWRRLVKHGGLGRFFFGTWAGWQFYVSFLVFWVGGCGIGLVLMNRFIFLTSTYRVPWTVSATFIQLAITHVLLLWFSSLTRALANPIQRMGLGGMIAPAIPASPPGNYRNPGKSGNALVRFGRWLSTGTGGIAGGGLFEFDRHVARQVLPLALLLVGKVVVSNLSFAYTVQPLYTLFHIGVVPLTLILTHFFSGSIHSTSTLSACLTATLMLLLGAVQRFSRVPWEPVVAGVASSFFVAFYPIQILRTHRALVANLTGPSEPTLLVDDVSSTSDASSRDETRAHYQLIHYTSFLTLLIMGPLVLLSGEVGSIYRNCYHCDVPWFWFLILCGGIGSTAVFISTPALVRATSPLTTNFVSVPKAALLLMFLDGKGLGPGGWVGIFLCLLSSMWYASVRRSEMRGRLGR